MWCHSEWILVDGMSVAREACSRQSVIDAATSNLAGSPVFQNWHRSIGGVPLIARSICRPHPTHVTLPQSPQLIGEHMLECSKFGFDWNSRNCLLRQL